jgi:hypothetical protein
MSSSPPRTNAWILGATIVSGLYAVLVLLAPARGLTFQWDDWMNLDRLTGAPWPERWLGLCNEHWSPLYLGIFDLERMAFGANHTFYLATSLSMHVLNVFLLAHLLERWTGDARAAAISATAFGVCPVWRSLAWGASNAGIVLCFTLVVSGFLALERHRTRGGVWLALAAASVVAAPLAWGGGIALGPVLVLEAWSLPRERRRRAILVLAGACVACALLYVLHASAAAEHSLPGSERQVGLAVTFLAELVGLGLVRQTLLIPVADEPLNAVVLALLAATALAVLLYAVRPAERRRLLLAATFLACVFAPIALARWRLLRLRPTAAVWSHYHYLTAIGWTAIVAIAVTAALRRGSRATLAVSVLALALLGAGHAQQASVDEHPYAPGRRRAHPLLIQHLRDAATAAEAPLYDAALPPDLAWGCTRAQDAIRALLPASIAWTSSRTPASVAPYENDPVLESLLRLR